MIDDDNQKCMTNDCIGHLFCSMTMITMCEELW